VGDGVGSSVMLSRAVAAAAAAAQLSCSLPHFFCHEHIFFKDLSDEVTTILTDIEALNSTSRRLNEFYRTVQVRWSSHVERACGSCGRPARRELHLHRGVVLHRLNSTC
jgi:hypothetical protein